MLVRCVPTSYATCNCRSTFSLLPDGRALVLYADTKKSAAQIAQWSPKDASSYADFGAALGKIGKVIGEALALTPTNIDSPNSGDLWGMLKTGRSIRNLGKKDLYRVLRWGPMAAAMAAPTCPCAPTMSGRDWSG